jgi:hypothetical protein
MRNEEKAKFEENRHGLIWAQLEVKAKDDPELAKRLEAAKSVIKRYSATFPQLADC